MTLAITISALRKYRIFNATISAIIGTTKWIVIISTFIADTISSPSRTTTISKIKIASIVVVFKIANFVSCFYPVLATIKAIKSAHFIQVFFIANLVINFSYVGTAIPSVKVAMFVVIFQVTSAITNSSRIRASFQQRKSVRPNLQCERNNNLKVVV